MQAAAAAAVKKIKMTNPITLGIAGGTGAVRFVAVFVAVFVVVVVCWYSSVPCSSRMKHWNALKFFSAG
jgi:hypothetical protein